MIKLAAPKEVRLPNGKVFDAKYKGAKKIH